jgi:hypothetical protein
LYHLRCTMCAVPCALYHLRCTICAVPFAPYYARCIMWYRRHCSLAVEVTSAGARAPPLTQGQAHGTVSSQRSSQSFGGQAVTCYVFLDASPELSGADTVPTLPTELELRQLELRRLARVTPRVVISTNAARASSPRVPSKSRLPSRIMAVRFGSTSFPPGCWDRPIGIGVRGARALPCGRARVSAAAVAGSPRRVGASCAVFNSRSRESQGVSSHPSKVDLHGSRASTRGSS